MSAEVAIVRSLSCGYLQPEQVKEGIRCVARLIERPEQ
jgi:hypothetical protein